MEIIKTADFEKSFAKLPADIKRLYSHQEYLFLKNWRDSRLHVKKVKGVGLSFSFRITRRYKELPQLDRALRKATWILSVTLPLLRGSWWGS